MIFVEFIYYDTARGKFIFQVYQTVKKSVKFLSELDAVLKANDILTSVKRRIIYFINLTIRQC